MEKLGTRTMIHMIHEFFGDFWILGCFRHFSRDSTSYEHVINGSLEWRTDTGMQGQGLLVQSVRARGPVDEAAPWSFHVVSVFDQMELL